MSNNNIQKSVEMNLVEIDNENYFKISNHDSMRPFFMSIVSSSNHWLFISSNGGITAGRKNPNFSLFPYYTDDKVVEFADITGSKTIFQVNLDNKISVWEPFSEHFTNIFEVSQNIYKNLYGNKIVFEEINHDLNLIFRYSWNTSNLFGFIKKSEIINNSNSDIKLTVLDGIQNVSPYGVEADLQIAASNLVDAYKRTELHKDSGLGIFALSVIIVDKAEPSEALKANIAWSLGLKNTKFLLSSLQLNNFRKKIEIQEETDIKGEKGAYFASTNLVLSANSNKKWQIVANVNQNQSQIIEICNQIKTNSNLENEIQKDIDLGTQNLIQLVASADGLQLSADKLKNTRHFANSLFNIMRGGIFDNNYQIDKQDFVTYLAKANKNIFNENEKFLNQLTNQFSYLELINLSQKYNNNDLIRLCTEYLPLKFSRRHGDPSRPWNKFSINLQNEIDGSKILDYEGNWRDIFQNWEALAHSYPEFIEGMIFKFLNATTFDGYNPYRLAKSGFDWETIEPDNPWSYIGYWGDHQIIYLLKFLEFIENHKPKKLEHFFETDYFVYANVPYVIKSYSEILKDAKNTIDFNHHLETKIREKIEKTGADGSLLNSSKNEIYHVNFIEKILATMLAKISNFIPEAGIWLTTQRPEWNDANNALVGNGVSMVTLCYLRRFLKFFEKNLSNTKIEKVKISNELANFFQKVSISFNENKNLITDKISDKNRKKFTDVLGFAGSEYRNTVYNKGFSGEKTFLSINEINEFLGIALQFIEHTIDANQRPDNLFHAYNILTIKNDEFKISNLTEMLEGQVAVLSSGYLTAEKSLKLLNSLKNSALYRKDQSSYLLYPNKELPKFLEKNNIPQNIVENSTLLKKLIENKYSQIINQDIEGNFHFNGNFRNANDLKNGLEILKSTEYKTLVENETDELLSIFEQIFNHKSFTGRSGTFFSYEGLGSIYWHMVSKLHLAMQEVCIKAVDEKQNFETLQSLISHFYEIGEGIGVHKSPKIYGAFPTDPYSHTPLHRGAQQPGMTGQVKEDILVRFNELGVFVAEGKLCFKPNILKKDEFLNQNQIFNYVNVNNEFEQIELETNSLSFTYCQVPIIYKISDKEKISVFLNNQVLEFDKLFLDENISNQIFARNGEVKKIVVSVIENYLN